SVPGTFTYTPSAGTVLNAGPNQLLSVRFAPTDTLDYNPVVKTARISISQAPLTVTANNASKVFGQDNPAFTAGFSGLVNGDTPASLGGTLSFSTAADASSPVGAYAITPGGLTSD